MVTRKRPTRAHRPKAHSAPRRNPDRALTVASVREMGASFGAKAAREIVRGHDAEELRWDVRIERDGRSLLSVLLEDTEQRALMFLDSVDDGDVSIAIENAPNGDALWAAFGRGVASTAKPVFKSFLTPRKANPSRRAMRPR